jgi:hypothetical protein
LKPGKQAALFALPQTRDQDAIVPFLLHAAMLSSQLIIAVADRVPQFDVKPGCRESTVHNCMNMEKIAREKLVEAWPNFTSAGQGDMLHGRENSGPAELYGMADLPSDQRQCAKSGEHALRHQDGN